jgi:hypothetical protein
MKKLFLALLATVSFASASNTWLSNVSISQIWVSPGTTPVVLLKDALGHNYAFYLNPTGNKEMLSLAQTAVQQDLLLNIYYDPSYVPTFTTGLSFPYVSSVTGAPEVFSLVLVR